MRHWLNLSFILFLWFHNDNCHGFSSPPPSLSTFLPNTQVRRISHDVGRYATTKGNKQIRYYSRPPKSTLHHCNDKHNQEDDISASWKKPFWSNNNNNNNNNMSVWKKTLTASFWIAGCTVGGGFLALPSLLVSEGIAIPNFIITMILVWMYFWAQSLVILDCFASSSSSSSNKTSMVGLAQETLGNGGRILTTILLTLVIEATLISQISRAGTLLPFLPYKLTCAIVSIGLAIPTFAIDTNTSSSSSSSNQLNSILVTSMIAFATIVFFQGNHQSSTWSQFLWTSFFPSSSSSTTIGNSLSNWYHTLPSILPTLLQLMVYGEILPIVAPLVTTTTTTTSKSNNNNNNNNTRDDSVGRKNFAIAFGSFIPLVLLTGWATLGISLTEASHSSSSSSSDPVQALLFHPASPIRLPLFGLAWSAIPTTILSSYLALKSIWNDIVLKNNNNNNNNTKNNNKWLCASSIVLPAYAIASTSPDIFLKAIDFAGSYPVLWLWGVLPPIISLRQTRRTSSSSSSKIKVFRVWSLLTISLGMVAMSILPDIQWLFSQIIAN